MSMNMKDTNIADFLIMMGNENGSIMFIDTESTMKGTTLKPIIYDFGYSIYPITNLKKGNILEQTEFKGDKNVKTVKVNGGTHFRYLVQEIIINHKLLKKIMDQNKKMGQQNEAGKLYYQQLYDLWNTDNIHEDPIINNLELDVTAVNNLYNLIGLGQGNQYSAILERHTKARAKAKEKINLHTKKLQNPTKDSHRDKRAEWLELWQVREHIFDTSVLNLHNVQLENQTEVIAYLMDVEPIIKETYIELLYDKIKGNTLDRIAESNLKNKGFSNIKPWRAIIEEINNRLASDEIVGIGGHNWTSADLTWIKNTSERLGLKGVELNTDKVINFCTQNLVRILKKSEPKLWNSLIAAAYKGATEKKGDLQLEVAINILIGKNDIIEMHNSISDNELAAAAMTLLADYFK